MSAGAIDLHYQVHGRGRPLLLLHGFLGAGVNWAPFLDELGREHRLIVPDLRGHGRSKNPSGTFTHRQCALDLFALVDRLGIEKFCAVGVSGGANALLHMATQQPERIEAMVLASATTHFPAPARKLMAQVTVESRSAEDWQAMRALHAHGDEQIRALWRQANAFKDSYDDLSFGASELATISARTLVVGGDRDPFYPVTIAVELYRSIPRAWLWILPGVGHDPVFGDRKADFLRVTQAFLRRRLPV